MGQVSVGATRVLTGTLKRSLDLALAIAGLVLSAPLWVVIGGAILVDDGPPIFYGQYRFGRGGRPFRLQKFRTMKTEHEAVQISTALPDDVRITRVGRVLRAMGLDELPQLWNILRGDMSFVGPRALAIGEAIRTPDGRIVKFEDIPGFGERLAVKPGLTSPATVYLPKDADPLQKLEYDLRYIQTSSFWLDVRLILLSLRISFQGRWETRDPKL